LTVAIETVGVLMRVCCLEADCNDDEEVTELSNDTELDQCHVIPVELRETVSLADCAVQTDESLSPRAVEAQYTIVVIHRYVTVSADEVSEVPLPSSSNAVASVLEDDEMEAVAVPSSVGDGFVHDVPQNTVPPRCQNTLAR